MPNNEFRLIPGSLPEPYCFTTFQALYNSFFSLGQVVAVNGSTFYNLGNTEPAPDLRGYPWFDTNDGTWYSWNIDVSMWTRPHEVPPSAQSRVFWVGTLTELQAYDGGDANPPGDASGPMWQEDEDFRSRFPVGPGTFPLSTTVVPVGGTGGLDETTILASAIPPHQHIVPVCANNSITGTPPPSASPASVEYGIGKDQGTGAVPDDSTQRPARSYPLTSESSNPITPPTTPLSILPPYRGAYIIKRTSRIYRLAP